MRRARLPKINWGRGRLKKHESFSAFAARFCRLNQISPFQFRIFWKEYDETDNFYIQKDRIGYIACILDEPKPIVRTVFRATRLYKRWGAGNTNIYQRIEYNSISYCPKCIKDGFHGNFHENNWIKKCPIHNIYLIAEPLLYSSIAKSKADRYLLHLTSLLDEKCPGWEIAQYKDGSVYKNNKIFKQFINWRNNAEKAIENIPTKCIGAFGC